MKKFILVLIVAVLIFHSNVFPKVYIVAENGGDFSSIQEAINNAVAGDSILVHAKQTPYSEMINFTRSGNDSEGFITLSAFPGENPVLDASGLSLGSDSIIGVVKIINKNYIRLQGFEIRNLITSDASKFPAGIWVRGTSHHIEILNNDVHNIEHNDADAGAHGIAVYGTSSSSIHNLLIERNDVHNCVLAWSESVALNGNVENFIVRNNIVHNNNNIAFDFIGFEGTCADESLDRARNGLVIGNIAHGIDSRSNPAYNGEASADGFYVDGGCDIIFEQNLAYNCNIGFEIASEHSGKTSRDIIVRNNFIRNNDAVGIAFGGYDLERGKTINCKIVNNTLYKNRNSDFDWGSEIFIQYYCDSITVKNNIIFSLQDESLIDYDNTTGTNFSIDHNLYFSEGDADWMWEGISYGSMTNYNSNSGNDNNSIYSDPVINLENDVPYLNNSSLAIDSGENLSAEIIGTKDYVGESRVLSGIVDIGAVEYAGFVDVNNYLQPPVQFKLSQNYPNPFNPTTEISWQSPVSCQTTIKVYNILGKEVATLMNKYQSAGKHKIVFNAANLSSGIYLYTIKAENFSVTKKALLLK